MWQKWVEENVLQKISGGDLVVDRVPYHMVLTSETAPTGFKLQKVELADWLEGHDVVPADWEDGWRQSRTKAEMKAVADDNKPVPRYLV